GRIELAMFASRNTRTSDDLHLLGDRARWGRVGYAGSAFAPAPQTYPEINGTRVRLTTVADSGRELRPGALVNLYPLVAAALYEIAFVREVGLLDTWRN